MKPELLSPAGDLEKLKFAFTYGADAVYMGGKTLGMRAKAKNFDSDDLEEGICFAHSLGKKIYITANIFAHNADLVGIEDYFRHLQKIGADALIISDPGVFSIAKKVVPEMEVHISTQANCTNTYSASFWQKLGAKRVVLARELSLHEISEIKVPGLALEAFVHGAMCMAYSGRCLISNFLSERDANKGHCSQPCRWKYSVVEEKSGETLKLYESENGAHIFSSRDLCMVGHIPDLVNAGVESFKIEGRMKTPYYVAVATKIYREAIDDFSHDPGVYESKLGYYCNELSRIGQREYTTGFYYGKVTGKSHAYGLDADFRKQDFLAVVLEYDVKTGMATIEQRNKFTCKDKVEIFTPKDVRTARVNKLWNTKGEEVSHAPHPKEVLITDLGVSVNKFDILRKMP